MARRDRHSRFLPARFRVLPKHIYILLLLVVLLLPLMGCGHRGNSAPTPSSAAQAGRYADAARRISTAGVTVDPFNAQTPYAFTVRLNRHGVAPSEAGQYAETAFDLLGPPFHISVYDNTGRKIARADDTGVSPKPHMKPR